MTAKTLVWSEQNGDIWKIANELHEKAMQVDVYLQATGNEVFSEKGCGISAALPTAEERQCYKRIITFPAHRLMLAAASPFLRKVLNEHYYDHRDACVNISIPQVSAETLQYILDFIYCGNMNIPPAAQEQVLEAAKMLQVVSLIHYFQPDYINHGGKNISVISEEYRDQSGDDAIKVPPKKRGRKRKVLKPDLSAEELHFFAPEVKREDLESELRRDEGDIFGRCRRRIKSRYSSDIYEVSLPKLRKFKTRTLSLKGKKEGKKIDLSEDDSLQAMEDENHHTYALNNPEVCKLEPESINNSDADQGITSDRNTSATISSNISTALDLSSPKSEQIQSHLVTLPSSSPSLVPSVVIPHLFASASSYLQESARPQSLTEISCGSFMGERASGGVLSKQSYEVSPLVAVSSASPQSSHINELSVITPPSATSTSLDNNTLKQQPLLSESQPIASSLHEEEEEPEEEDGLFKLQVLLKECEDFSGGVNTNTSVSLNGTSGENITVGYGTEEGEDGVDINQWISEEIHNYIIPKLETSAHSAPGEYSGVKAAITTSLQEEKFENIDENTKCDRKSLESSDQEKKTEYESTSLVFENTEKNCFECEICGKTYSDLRSCQAHIRGVHLEARQMCKHCGKMFKRRCDLYQHERRHSEANVPCKVCGKNFKLRKDLAAHMATHVGRKKFSCNDCDKELTSLRNLKNHIASVHKKQRAFECHICKKTYSKACSLQVHMRSVHTGERPFKCNVCSKRFCDPALLKLHHAVHTGERKYSCTLCDRRFNQYSNMISHQRVHSNERPFTCVICKENFKTKEGLLKHKWVHTGLKPLKCSHCSKEFRIKESYERHMLKSHGEVVHLPKIYFEVPEDSKASVSTSAKVIRSLGDSDIQEVASISLSGDLSEKTVEKEEDMTGDMNQDMVPVVQFVREIGQEESPAIQLSADTANHIELNYPLLASNADPSGNGAVISSLTNHITSESDVSQSIDVESLLQNGVNTSVSNSVVMAKENQAEILSTQLHETVMIINEASDNSNEVLSDSIHQSSAIKIWVPRDDPVAGDTQNDSGSRTNILIVSDESFSDSAQALTVLGSQVVSPHVVQTMVLNRSKNQVCEINVSEELQS
ncbi:uncharacterized protein LOC119577920 [Penaeus monodon]|uniref:uncharacterized protein LOC119577920 n=1 Tax=Penaeus monodon TaxID=6687 RepID=UPI0018A716EF|nr:uncharacterized protein LOC119577920 [Penaeus monodon]